MKARSLLCLVAVVLVNFVVLLSLAQGQFVKTLGETNDDWGQSLVQTSDGGFVVTGGTRSFDPGINYLLLARFGPTGNHLWTRTLGGGVVDYGTSLVETSDGGFVVAGLTESFGAGSLDFLLTKFDVSGNHLWTRTLGGSGEDYARCVVEASDGGLVVAGVTWSFGVAFYELLLAKFDSTGNHIWTRTLGGDREDYSGYEGCIIETSDGEFVVTGSTYSSFGTGNEGNLLLVKLDAAGNHLWTRTLGGGTCGYSGISVIQASDGGFVVIGQRRCFNPENRDLLLAKFDSTGNHLWTRLLVGESGDDAGYSVIEASDGGLMGAGYTFSFGAGGGDFLLTKFDSTGNLLWARTLGGADDDVGYYGIGSSDGGFVMTGRTSSFGVGGYDMPLATFDASGNSCLGEFVTFPVDTLFLTVTSPTPTVTTPSPTITSPSPIVATLSPTLTVVCEVPPRIFSITDVGNDQGKQVRVKWHRCSWDDVGAPFTITEYSLWRRVDQYVASGSEGEISPTPKGNPYDRLAYPPGEWDFIKTIPARGESTYSTICPTLADSTISDGMYWSVFFISAMTPDPLAYYDSEPDSGYSLDNLPPAPPQGLTGESGDAEATLWWKANTEEDLWYYTIYRTTDGLPDTSDWVANVQETTYTDTGLTNGTVYCYRVCAFDLSGNRSDYSDSVGCIQVGVPHEGRGSVLPQDFSLSQNYPNPFNPTTDIRYALPENCRVKLEIFNVLGQRVRTFVDEEQPAGYKSVRWDGRDDRGQQIASGVYLYRISAGDYIQTRRMVLLR